MRICVLQFSYEGPDSDRGKLVNEISRSKLVGSQHTIERRFIYKENFKEQIDSILREGFDFHINLLWSTTEHAETGIQACQYFESLNVPSAGSRSWGRFWTKDSFYKHARKRGAPRVPGLVQFPLFVQPSNGCISQVIDENYVCHNERELRDVLCRIKKQLGAYKGRRIDAHEPTASAELHDLIDWYSDEIAVQEFIDGEEYTVTVIEMGDSAVALNPCIKTLSRTERLHTLGARSEVKTCKELLKRKNNSILFQSLQRAALEAFEAGMFRGSHMGCEVNLRVNREKEVFVLSVKPPLMAFLKTGNELQDLSIIETFPGGLSAAVNVFIANYFAHHDVRRMECSKVATAYDDVAPEYDGQGLSNSQDEENFRYLVKNYDFQGTVSDLACGTGFFGRLLTENGFRNSQRTGRLFGFDLSPGMVDLCRKTGVYDQVYVSGMQTCLLQYFGHGEVDHIVCFGAVHFLSPEEFASFLVQCFIIANKSITVAVDEIPDSYNEHLREKGLSHMHSTNHLGNMEAFGEPQSWLLVSRRRHYSWTSPTTGDDVYSTFFRFERVDGGNVRISGPLEKN
jgi:SAM-dependent methyltransferase